MNVGLKCKSHSLLWEDDCSLNFDWNMRKNRVKHSNNHTMMQIQTNNKSPNTLSLSLSLHVCLQSRVCVCVCVCVCVSLSLWRDSRVFGSVQVLAANVSSAVTLRDPEWPAITQRSGQRSSATIRRQTNAMQNHERMSQSHALINHITTNTHTHTHTNSSTASCVKLMISAFTHTQTQTHTHSVRGNALQVTQLHNITFF